MWESGTVFWGLWPGLALAVMGIWVVSLQRRVSAVFSSCLLFQINTYVDKPLHTNPLYSHPFYQVQHNRCSLPIQTQSPSLPTEALGKIDLCSYDSSKNTRKPAETEQHSLHFLTLQLLTVDFPALSAARFALPIPSALPCLSQTPCHLLHQLPLVCGPIAISLSQVLKQGSMPAKMPRAHVRDLDSKCLSSVSEDESQSQLAFRK